MEQRGRREQGACTVYSILCPELNHLTHHTLLRSNKNKPNTNPFKCFYHADPLLRGKLAMKVRKKTPSVFLDNNKLGNYVSRQGIKHFYLNSQS